MTYEQAKDQIAKKAGYSNFLEGIEDRMKPTNRYTVTELINKSAELYADSVARDKDKLIKQLWQLWDSMAECGELHIGPKFSQEYKQLKTRIPT